MLISTQEQIHPSSTSSSHRQLSHRSNKRQQKLHDTLIGDICKEVIRNEGKGSNTHLLRLDKSISTELYKTFYQELHILNRRTLYLLLRTFDGCPSKVNLSKTLYIRVGCTISPIPKNTHPASPPNPAVPCRLSDKDACEHIEEHDIPKLYMLALRCSPVITTFILHTNRPMENTWNTIYPLTFARVIDAEVPIEIVGYRAWDEVFPNARRLRVAINNEHIARAYLDRHNYQSLQHLQNLLLSMSYVNDPTLEEILNVLRVPTNISCVGIERDRGYGHPCPQTHLQACLANHRLTLVMSPEGLDSFTSQWRLYLRSHSFGRIPNVEKALDEMFTLNNCEGNEIWDKMETQVRKKLLHIQSILSYRA
ncbi:hypothetical protein VNI00_016638 [Paramarasmius palmivorus]|uniref:Uncharacterized protein n=1 Tax=Paramarasmius palmivorus TaxID=297713 RepID=A0AAW0BCE3_9AGAR